MARFGAPRTLEWRFWNRVIVAKPASESYSWYPPDHPGVDDAITIAIAMPCQLNSVPC